MTSLVIVMEGGIIQSIISDSEARVLIKDYDVDVINGEEVLDERGLRYYSRRESVAAGDAIMQADDATRMFSHDDKVTEVRDRRTW